MNNTSIYREIFIIILLANSSNVFSATYPNGNGKAHKELLSAKPTSATDSEINKKSSTEKPQWTLDHILLVDDLSSPYRINSNNLIHIAAKIKQLNLDIHAQNKKGHTLRWFADQADSNYEKRFKIKASVKFPQEWKKLIDALQ